MMWVKWVSAGLLAALYASSGGPAYAGTMILATSGPEVAARYKPGTVLASGQIVLRDNEWVQVVSDGKVTRLLGPSTTKPKRVSKDDETLFARLAKSLAPMWQRKERSAAVFGVTRGFKIASGPPGLWFIDASRGGVFCVKDGTEAQLWRPKHARDESYTVQPARGTSLTFVWPAGAATVDWPTKVSPDEGQYVVRAPAGLTRDIAIRRIPAGLDGASMLAELGERGCMDQLERAVTRLPDDNTAPRR